MKKVNIQYSQSYNADMRDKAFDKLSHRLYFVIDFPPREALLNYMHITRQSLPAALSVLSNISDAEIEWIRGYVARSVNFRYKISVDEKLEYIRRLKECVNSNQQ